MIYQLMSSCLFRNKKFIPQFWYKLSNQRLITRLKVISYGIKHLLLD